MWDGVSAEELMSDDEAERLNAEQEEDDEDQETDD
jgi:hypothetical protein